MIEVETKQKILSVFSEPGVIVDKSLSCLTEQFRRLPSFVVDFLIAKMVDSENPTPGLDRISDLLNAHF